MNDTDTKKLLTIIKAAYGNVEITDATVMVWKMALENPTPIPYAAASWALSQWIPVNKWAPKPVELRDLVAEKVCGIPNADEAWVQLLTWLKAGYPGMPDRRPPLPALIADAVRQIGGTSMVRNGDATREQFAKAYDRLRRERMAVVNVTEAWAALAAPERKAIA